MIQVVVKRTNGLEAQFICDDKHSLFMLVDLLEDDKGTQHYQAFNLGVIMTPNDLVLLWERTFKKWQYIEEPEPGHFLGFID